MGDIIGIRTRHNSGNQLLTVQVVDRIPVPIPTRRARYAAALVLLELAKSR